MRSRSACSAAGRPGLRGEFPERARRFTTIARDMGKGAASREVSTSGNGHDPALGSEADGEIAVAAARRLTRGRVLVLTASYEPLNVCTVRRALVLLLKEKAEILEHGDDVLRSETMRLDRPEVIRLISFVRVPRDIHRRRITRK